MIVVLKHNPNPEQLQSLITWLQEKGIIIHTSIGEGNMLLGLVGDTSKIDADLISALDIVEDVKRVQEPYKNANRKFHPEDTVVKVGNTQIGGGNLTLMAGPCSVESEEQVVAIAKAVKASGATMLRGGAFKPRTSPYSFQGLGEVGLRYLEIAKEETGLPIVTELMNIKHLPLFENAVVVCREVSGGIVPMDGAERAWREAHGTLVQRLAREAAHVTRVLCGLTEVLK